MAPDQQQTSEQEDNEQNNDNDQDDQAAQEQSETENDENNNDDESSDEEDRVDIKPDVTPLVEHQTEQILDQEGQESIDRQLQEELAGTSRIDVQKEAQIEIEPLQRKNPYRKRLEKANTQAALNKVIGQFIERYQLPDFLRETLYQQTPNIQKEFVDSYAARGFPDTTDEQFKQQLEYYINKASDRYRTQATTAPKDRGLLSKASKLAGNAAHTLSAYLPEPGGKYEPAIYETRPIVKVTPTTPLKDHTRRVIKGKAPTMATMTERPRRSATAQPMVTEPRTRIHSTPHPPGAYPPDKFSTPKKSTRKALPKQSPRYQQHYNPGTPGGPPGPPDDDDPDDDNPDDQDDQDDNENFKEEENNEEQDPYDYEEVEEVIPDWKGKPWKSMFDQHVLANMQPITKKPKIPTPTICTADANWNDANKFDTWAIDVLDYLLVHHITPEHDEALPYAAGYLGGLAKEFMSTWRNDPLNEHKKLRSFLNDLRGFCIPTNYKDKLWEDFNNVKQRGRPIQEVAN